MKLIYLLSAPYSGSTLLSFLLSSHKKIATVGELSGPDPRIPKDEHPCSCGATIVNCEFWNSIHSELQQQSVALSIWTQEKYWKCISSDNINRLITYVSNISLIDKLQRFILKNASSINKRIESYNDNNILLMNGICRSYNASFFLDSSKDLKRLQYLRCCTDLDIYVIHLVRDGRGQTLSKMKRGHDMKTSAKAIVRYDKQADNFNRYLPDNHYLLIRYEDVCVNSQATFDAITSFLGLEQEVLILNNVNTGRHILGNPMLRTFTGKIRLNEKWENDLSPKSLDVFNSIVGSRNEKYGYC